MLAGAVIGLLQLPTMLLMRFNLGISSSYVIEAGLLLALLFPSFYKRYPYFSNYLLTSVKCSWQVALALGMAFGGSNFEQPRCSPNLRNRLSNVALGFLSSTLSGSTPITSTWGPLSALLGGFLIIFGSRLADGCTLGHGASGMAALSVPSVFSTCCIFGGGILARALFGWV